ncbi:MAG: hypothetical protein EBR09_03655 [Proteobacteria bacterium]|nr:hypothetical protein [Pseudomonadota bacterium]
MAQQLGRLHHKSFNPTQRQTHLSQNFKKTRFGHIFDLISHPIFFADHLPDRILIRIQTRSQQELNLRVLLTFTLLSVGNVRRQNGFERIFNLPLGVLHGIDLRVFDCSKDILNGDTELLAELTRSPAQNRIFSRSYIFFCRFVIVHSICRHISHENLQLQSLLSNLSGKHSQN